MARELAGALVAGALGGAASTLVVAWLLQQGGARADDVAALRADVATLTTRQVALEPLAGRIAALEARAVAVAADPQARAAASQLADDLRLLRDSVRLELASVDATLRRLDAELEDAADAEAGGDPAGPLPEEEEPRWVVLAGDPDPGVRFSALARLGRARTDRSATVSVESLADRSEMVVWQAVRNLGGFRERSAAPALARLLTHEAAVVRSAAHDALVLLGAPADTGFDPVAPAEARAAAVARLRRWADEQ